MDSSFREIVEGLGLDRSSGASSLLGLTVPDTLRIVGEASSCIVVSFDRRSSGVIVFATHAAERLFGYEPGELDGMMLDSLIPTEFKDSHSRHVAAFLANPVNRTMGRARDLFGLRKSGGCFRVAVQLNPKLSYRCVVATVLSLED